MTTEPRVVKQTDEKDFIYKIIKLDKPVEEYKKIAIPVEVLESRSKRHMIIDVDDAIALYDSGLLNDKWLLIECTSNTGGILAIKDFKRGSDTFLVDFMLDTSDSQNPIGWFVWEKPSEWPDPQMKTAYRTATIDTDWQNDKPVSKTTKIYDKYVIEKTIKREILDCKASS